MTLRTLSIVIASLIPMGFGSFAIAAIPDSFRSEEDKLGFINHVTQPWNSVDRWLIEYEAVPSAGTMESNPVHKIMAVAASGDFFHLSAHFPSGIPWNIDPYCQEFFIHDSKICHRWTFNRAYSEEVLHSNDYVPGTTRLDVLLSILPRWPLSDYKMQTNFISGAPVVLVDTVRSQNCRLLEKSEIIGGEQCAIFDYNGLERIWVATNKGLCMMRRDSLDPRSKNLIERILTDQVDQVAPGLWLPTKYRVQLFRAAPSTNSSALELENTVRILSCKFNKEVPESTFVAVQRSGSIKLDEENKVSQVVSGGEDLLDDIANFIVKFAHLPSQPMRRAHPMIWLFVGLTSGIAIQVLLFSGHNINSTGRKKSFYT